MLRQKSRRNTGMNSVYRQSVRRVIIKQGYLKKLPNASKVGSALKKMTRRWFVFGTLSNNDPYLEYYENEDAIFGQEPINMLSLSGCTNIRKGFKGTSLETVFTICLPERELSLYAPSRALMVEWCAAIETKLHELAVLDSIAADDDDDHDYVDDPLGNRSAFRTESYSVRPAAQTHTTPLAPLSLNLSAAEQKSADQQDIFDENLFNEYRMNARQMMSPENRDNTFDVYSRSNRMMSPQNGEASFDVYQELWSKNATDTPSPAQGNDISSENSEGPALPPRPPSSHGQLQRQASRKLSFVSGSGKTADGSQEPSSLLVDIDDQPNPETAPIYGNTENQQNGATALPPPISPPPALPNRPRSLATTPSQPATPQTPDRGSMEVPQTPTRGGNTIYGMFARPVGMSDDSFGVPSTPILHATYSFSGAGSTPTSPTAGATSPSALPEKMREAIGFDEADAVFGWGAPPANETDAPPAYFPQRMLSRNANVSLKQNQIDMLRKEMNNSGGVKVVLKRRDSYLALALVEAFGSVWLAGWNQTARPFLHNAFHIGDQIISINGQVLESARMAYKLIKHCSDTDKITFILRRVPHARVYAMKRMFDEENLGLFREGGTAEIARVHPEGLTGRSGLPSQAPTLDGTNFCNWWLTEINHRSLNLFFKDNEVEPRLNAVGLDISIMVQPVEFINEIKKKLKKIKNYKDFLVQ